MVNKKAGQLIFETIYLVLGFIGTLGSLGYFDKSFQSNFFIFYTNISNYLCLGVIIYSFVITIKKTNNSLNNIKISSRLHFICVVIIIMTFLVYNSSVFIDWSFSDYALSLSSLCFHLILPIMFTIHYFAFCPIEKLKWYDPLFTIILPILYVSFIQIRALLFPNVQIKYPYFFLNVQSLGFGKFILWILLLIVIMLLISYMIYFINLLRIEKTSKKHLVKKIKST